MRSMFSLIGVRGVLLWVFGTCEKLHNCLAECHEGQLLIVLFTTLSLFTQTFEGVGAAPSLLSLSVLYRYCSDFEL